MTVIDRAHRLVLILLVTTIPLIYLVDLVVEVLRDDITFSAGWQVYVALIAVASFQIATKRWNADWVIVVGGAGTAALGVLSYLGFTTSIDITTAAIIVPIVGLVAVAVSRHAPVLTGVVLGIATVVLATIAFREAGLGIDDLVTKSAAAATLFGLGGWLLYQLRRGYEEQFAARDRFVATVSHELRSPLTALAGFTEALGQGVVDPHSPEATEILELMSEQAREAADIVEDLLVAARAEAGQVTVEVVPTELSDQLENVVTTLHLDRSSGKSVTADPQDATVRADPLRVRQIIRNLLANAVRHGGHKITARTYQGTGVGIVDISDDGPGFDTDEIETMFSAYGRSRNADVSTGSIGLGLTVSKDLAELMGGTLEAIRSRGITTFRLALPLSDVATEAPADRQ